MCSFMARNVPAHLASVCLGGSLSNIILEILRGKLTDYCPILRLDQNLHRSQPAKIVNRKMLRRTSMRFSFMMSVNASIHPRIHPSRIASIQNALVYFSSRIDKICERNSGAEILHIKICQYFNLSTVARYYGVFLVIWVA